MEPILIGIDDNVIELKGQEAQTFIANLEADNLAEANRVAQLNADKAALLNKLGLTADELKVILG
jgi:hypothetical protein